MDRISADAVRLYCTGRSDPRSGTIFLRQAPSLPCWARFLEVQGIVRNIRCAGVS